MTGELVVGRVTVHKTFETSEGPKLGDGIALKTEREEALEAVLKEILECEGESVFRCESWEEDQINRRPALADRLSGGFQSEKLATALSRARELVGDKSSHTAVKD